MMGQNDTRFHEMGGNVVPREPDNHSNENAQNERVSLHFFCPLVKTSIRGTAASLGTCNIPHCPELDQRMLVGLESKLPGWNEFQQEYSIVGWSRAHDFH